MDKVQLSEPLRFLTKIGFSPFQSDNLSYIKQLLSVVLYLGVITSSFLEILTNFHKTTVIRGFEVIAPYYQIAWKFFVLIKHKDKLKILVEESQKFWTLDAFGEHENNANSKNHQLVEKCFQIYQRLVYFSVVQYIVAALINELPMVLSYGETQGLNLQFRLFYFIFDTVYIYIIICLMLGFDGLFFYIIAHILSEIKMVKVAFGNSHIQPQWKYEERLRVAVEHHRFVLKFVKCVDNVYSLMLLHQQFCFIFALCFASYLLIENGVPPDYEHVTKYVPYIVSYFLQVLTYCLAGDLISSWSLEISDQIFYDDWLLNKAYQNKLEKIIIIQRAQRPASLTLAGFRNLDLQNFTLVVKQAASFFTFVNTITNK